jgi:hypothetical protein
MVFPSHGNYFSSESTLRKNTQIGRYFGMITSNKRLRRIVREIDKEVVMITCPLLVIKGSEKERFLERRVTIMEDHHSQGRRRT